MSSRTYDITSPLGSLAQFVPTKTTATEAKGEGSLARKLTPNQNVKEGWTNGQINVVKDYSWTLSNTKRDDIPYIRLVEYECNETQIKRQLEFYSKLIPEKYGINRGTQEVLSVYDEIFPKDNPTDFSYWFPYFNKTGFELGTQNWQQLDPIGESLKNIAGGASKSASSLGFKGTAGAINAVTEMAEFANTAAETKLAWTYPSVGVQDRPRVFAGHNERQIVISFPLYNTLNEWDWTKNRDLVYLLMSQNLFNKRDLITGVPPVFYDIYVPGQYYCYAAAMTNINVENLGNTRLMEGEYIIPDAYQVNLTLTEMVMPSKNQFEAITSGAARKFVNSSTFAAKQAITSVTTSIGTAIEGTQKIAEGSRYTA